jgi:hypothetical protein
MEQVSQNKLLKQVVFVARCSILSWFVLAKMPLDALFELSMCHVA